MKNRRVPLLLVTLAMILGTVNIVSATVIGTASFANCAGGGVTISATNFTWSPNGTVAGTGCITTGLGTTLTWFGGVVGPGVNADIKNLVVGGGAVSNFIHVLGTPIDFQLATLLMPYAPTNGTNCVGLLPGQSCIPAIGLPIVLQATTIGTDIGLQMSGTITDGVGQVNPWSGLLVSQSALTAQQIQFVILGGGSVSVTHSEVVTVTNIIPEPGTFSMLLVGAGLLGFCVSRLSRKSG